MRTPKQVISARFVCIFLWALLCGPDAWAHPPTTAARLTSALVVNAPPGPQDDTIRARLKACLLSGDMACVVDQYLLLKNLGRMPGWLVAFQNAFAINNRRAGECERVAQTIHLALREFAQKPTFIRFSIKGGSQVMGFDVLEQGVLVRSFQVSDNAHHVAVNLGGRVIDAYTGLAGLPLSDYLARLTTRPDSQIIHQIVEVL